LPPIHCRIASSSGGDIDHNQPLLPQLQQLEQQHALTILAVDDPTFFPTLLAQCGVPIATAFPPNRLPYLIDWNAYRDLYTFNMSGYLHTFDDYEQRFAHILSQTQLPSYEAVMLFAQVTPTHNYTISSPIHLALPQWEQWFGFQTLLVTHDGAFVLESWDTYSWDIRTNVPLAGSMRLQEPER
jgi:hypothetical protein